MTATSAKRNLVSGFLLNRNPVTWSAPSGFPKSLSPAGVFTQQAPHGLEVVITESASKPSTVDMHKGWTKRKDGRASPVLLVCFYPDGDTRKALLCGPVGDQPVVYPDIEEGRVERIADSALDEPTHHFATRNLRAALSELDSPFPGLRNQGLLATQELKAGVPDRSDWKQATKDSKRLLGKRGRKLVEGLGFHIESLPPNAYILTAGERKCAVAVLCDEDEAFETPATRFGSVSPVSKALAVASREKVDWVILTRSSEIRLYSAKPNVGVGRKGRAETYVELNLSLVPEEMAGYLQLLFSAEALAPEGSLHEVLSRSADFAAELAVRLRERVYHQTVPALARAVADRLTPEDPKIGFTERELADAYEQVMVILFRLLFVAYAEDKDLLPCRTNDSYRQKSLTAMAQQLSEDRHLGRLQYDDASTDLWDGVVEVWDTVRDGDERLGVPAYNGDLFSPNPDRSRSGAAIAGLAPLTDAEFAPALTAVLVDEGKEGYGPVDFRSLSVREFGTIYEGLLESKLSVAQDDLVENRTKGGIEYIPLLDDEDADVAVAEGTVYFHNRSGVRKATGSYFTKPFAVEHLLDTALEPALDDHMHRLEQLHEQDDEAALSKAFFDFRCADLAMGSAHFLVAAVDRIEARFSEWLTLHPVPAVTAKLNRLEKVARDALGDMSASVEIESSSLLRRQVARHCVYGVDKNRIAVELARLAVWVHTFVPGLPLSYLNHNLIEGDSLTGVSSIEEAVKAVTYKTSKKIKNTGQVMETMWTSRLRGMLNDKKEYVEKLGQINDADKDEVKKAQEADALAREAVAPVTAVFDIATAVHAGAIKIERDFDLTLEKITSLANSARARETIQRLMPVHYPSVWPEVFLRGEGREGFDCLIGNPPWEQVVVQEHVWWGTHLPRIRGLPIEQMNDEIARFRRRRRDLEAEYAGAVQEAEETREILRQVFPGLGAGRTDLYKAFAWRNLRLVRVGGHFGLVLPRSALNANGMSNWRAEVVREREREREREYPTQNPRKMSVATIINHKGWAFEGIHNSYTVALVAITRASQSPPASTPTTGDSTELTDDTPSPLSRSVSPTQEPSRGGGFEGDPDEPYVAIYPGPASSLAQFRELVDGKPETIPISEFSRWSSSNAFPQIPTRSAFRVWRKIKRHPRLDGADLDSSLSLSLSLSLSTMASQTDTGRLQRNDGQTQVHHRQWKVRPFAELHATADKPKFVLDGGESAHTEKLMRPTTNPDSSLTVEKQP